MRALIQRVQSAKVDVDGDTIGAIGPGLLILACAMADDSPEIGPKLADKIAKLRIFPDETGRMNRSLIETDGAALVVSQFTLAADTSRGNRPGFSTAAPPEEGAARIAAFAAAFEALDLKVEQGRFGADMKVSLVNDGPVTIWLDTNT
ncbi:D-aminoacyl-tRNA deacylase [Rhodobacteraceae bacterium]|nr:D-aminoacyl-tRNA deacylase [Paracoccaceae bacterium]